MARTATKKRKPKTGVEQYTAASPWKRRLIWLYYLGHLTISRKTVRNKVCLAKSKKKKGDPTIGGVEQYKASGNIKTYCSQTSFYDQGKVSVQIFSRPSLVFSLSLSLSRRVLSPNHYIVFFFICFFFLFYRTLPR